MRYRAWKQLCELLAKASDELETEGENENSGIFTSALEVAMNYRKTALAKERR